MQSQRINLMELDKSWQTIDCRIFTTFDCKKMRQMVPNIGNNLNNIHLYYTKLGRAEYSCHNKIFGQQGSNANKCLTSKLPKLLLYFPAIPFSLYTSHGMTNIRLVFRGSFLLDLFCILLLASLTGLLLPISHQLL